MKREVVKSNVWALIVTVLLGVAIVVGSRNLSRFDSALVAYTFASLFAAFGLTYRYTMWLQRPPTALYWRRGWEAFFKRPYRKQNAINWFKRVTVDLLLNHFIWLRGKYRWLAHWLIMWGCIIAALITFPLVFGWLMFESVPGDLDSYRIYVFGFPGSEFKVESIFGFLLFHGLVWAAFLVIAGVMIAMHRRMRDEGAAALQFFREDILPHSLRNGHYHASLAPVWKVFPHFSAARADRSQFLQGCGASRRACKMPKMRTRFLFTHARGRFNQGSTRVGLPV